MFRLSRITCLATLMNKPSADNNRRDIDDYGRFKMILTQLAGKRLTYESLIGSKEAETETR